MIKKLRGWRRAARRMLAPLGAMNNSATGALGFTLGVVLSAMAAPGTYLMVTLGMLAGIGLCMVIAVIVWAHQDRQEARRPHRQRRPNAAYRQGRHDRIHPPTADEPQCRDRSTCPGWTES